MTWFCVGVENSLASSLDRNYCGFCVEGHRNRLVFRVGIETDLTSVLGSKLFWLLCGGSQLTWFLCGDPNRLVFCAGVKIDLVLCAGRK